MKSLFFTLTFLSSTLAFAQETKTEAPKAEVAAETSIEKDFDSLGGNRILLERAKILEPETDAWVVQNRMVSRDRRFEISPEVSASFGGDTYVRTQNVGLNVHYHFNPRWSVGLKYNHSFNTLTPEGENLVNRAIADIQNNPGRNSGEFPEIDYPRNETLGLINWYPVYGKMNLLDRGVAHFDLYVLAGYGQMQMDSGTSTTLTAGGGVGFWLNPKMSTRLEMRYQNYKSAYAGGEKTLDPAVASLQMGWML